MREEAKSKGCPECGCPSDMAHYSGCPIVGKQLGITQKIEHIKLKRIDNEQLIEDKLNEIIDYLNKL